MRRLAPVLLLAASVFVHWPGARAEFTFDDYQFVPQNASIRSLGAAGAAFDAPFPPQQADRGLYRPLTNFSYALDYAVGGDDPRRYHETNVLLYLAVVLLAYRLAREYAPPGPAFAVALLFSVHPVHTEAVDGVSGRSELLSFGFALASMILYARLLRSSAVTGSAPAAPAQRAAAAGLLAGSVLGYAATCLSKESGALLPAVLAVQWAAAGLGPGAPDRRRRLRALATLLPFAATLAVYTALRVSVIGHFGPSDPVLATGGLGARIHTIGAVFLEYLRLLVNPRNLQLDWYYQEAVGIQSGASLRSVLGLASLAAFVAIAAALSWRVLREVARNRPGGAGDSAADTARGAGLVSIAIFFAFLLPVSHVFDIGALMAERFLFAPSLGFIGLAVLAAAVVLRARVAQPVARIAAAAVVIALLAAAGVARTAERAPDWRDDVRMWQVTGAALPDDVRVHANLGAAWLHRGDLDRAEPALRRAVALDDSYAPGVNNLAYIYLHRGEDDAARALFERVVARDPENYIAWNNLGSIATRRRAHAEAATYFARSVAANPNYPVAARNLAAAREALTAAR